MTSRPSADLQAFLTLPVSAPVREVQAAAAKVAADETTLLKQLKSYRWPSSAQTEVTTLEAEIATEQPIYQQAAAATSIAAIKNVLHQNQATIAARAAAASQLRQALGLPAPTQPTSPIPTSSTTS